MAEKSKLSKVQRAEKIRKIMNMWQTMINEDKEDKEDSQGPESGWNLVEKLNNERQILEEQMKNLMEIMNQNSFELKNEMKSLQSVSILGKKRCPDTLADPYPLDVLSEEVKIAPLENFINNPGLQHLAKEIFLNLNSVYLEKCQKINQSASQILENPLFWLEKFVWPHGLSKDNQEDWRKTIQSVKNTDKEKQVATYLRWTLKNEGLCNLPCYTSPTAQDDFRKKIHDAVLHGPIGKKHALKKYDQFALNTSCFYYPSS